MTISGGTESRKLLNSYVEYIQPEDVKRAFQLLLNHAERDARYVLRPHSQGIIKRVVDYKVDRKRPYAFIVNRHHLLFYFRKPTQSQRMSLGSNDAYMPLQARPSRNELAIKIDSTEKARQVLSLLSFDDPDSYSLTESNSKIKDQRRWTDEELRASVIAYRNIQSRTRLGEQLNKKAIYMTLAEKFGRTDKAFEFRMQNISAVLSLMGREWILSLKPAAHVGTDVATRIEQIINGLDKNDAPPVVANEIKVRTYATKGEIKKPHGNKSPARTESASTTYVRSQEVKGWVLHRAKGRCECCLRDAPFKTFEGFPYLEVHHLRKLSDGGSDCIGNAVAICPNCHRELHYGVNAMNLRAQIYDRIDELVPE